jgi:isocitrate/isopropylmalate dehydrogenase
VAAGFPDIELDHLLVDNCAMQLVLNPRRFDVVVTENPFGAIGSVAAMLEYSFGLKEEAAAVNAAIEAVLNSGRVTADLKPAGPPATTVEVGEAVCEAI